MKLKVGKSYKTRNSERIIKIVDQKDPDTFLGDNGVIYRESGNFCDRDPSWDLDLVEEIKNESN